MALTGGTRFGPYEILAMLGAGGMGEVYRARDTRLKRDVAVKVLPSTFASDRERLHRFEQEARSAAALNHPNIVSVHDIGTADGSPYIVSELLDGEDLRQVLRRGPVSARKALDYATQAAHGLAAAHDVGIVHRDLKPENLFITKDGRVKILDFGLAKLSKLKGSGSDTDTVESMLGTEAGHVFGTVGYMSPEQVRGQSVDHRSDIFSFGAILYELFSGKRAFSGDSAADTMSAILHQEPPELTSITPPVDPLADHTIRHCLEKQPAERYQSAHDLAFQLKMAGEGLFPKAQTVSTDRSVLRGRWLIPVIVAVALAVSSLPFLIGRFSAKGESPAYKRLTFRSGSIGTARFSNDGRTIVYGAAWEGNVSEIFLSRVESSDARPLGIGPSELLAVSKTGELAVLMKPKFGVYNYMGTLATVSLEGGTPREITEDVTSADWAPDGSALAIVHDTDKLEFPAGKVLFHSAGWLDHARFSPDGKSIAFIDHPSFGSNAGSLAICDVNGGTRVIAANFDVAMALAWSRDGKEIWFSGVRGSGPIVILGISRGGKERLIARSTGWMTVQDIAPDGRMLFTRDDWHIGVKALAPHSSEERDLSWFDWSLMGAISADGEIIAFSESGEAVSSKGLTYVRGINGTPSVRLGEGRPWSISPDKKWVLATPGENVAPQLILLPTGAGEPKRYSPAKGEIFGPKFLRDGKQVIFAAATNGSERMYFMALDTGEVKPALPEGVIGFAVSPDGRYIAASSGSDPKYNMYDLSGGPARPIIGLGNNESVAAWGNQPLPLYVVARDAVAVNLFRLDPATGKRRLWRRLMPSDPAGVRMIADLKIAAEVEAYGYSYYRLLSQLYVTEGKG